jgi:plastocyanin
MDEENKTTKGYGKRPIWQWFVLYAVIAVVAYGLFYHFVLAKNSGNNSAQTGVYQQNASSIPSPTTAVAAEKITVEGNEYAFIPSTITLKKGQAAEITFKNTGKYPHNLSITDLGVKSKTIMPGEQDVITFTPDKTGSFAYLCTIPGHADKGMKGTLTVE